MKSFIQSLLEWKYRSVVGISIIILCFNCIDPYAPNIENFESLLVVDALLTDEAEANYVKLLRSSKIQGSYEKVTGASVVISYDNGESTTLVEKAAGEYWTDPDAFRGEVGNTYTLNIVTTDGAEYLSDPCFMYPVSGMDSVYFEYKEEIPEDYILSFTGVNISVASTAGSASGYRRWTYEEWWKFRIPFPVVSANGIDSIPVKNEICWQHNKSGEIILRSDRIEDGKSIKEPLLFLPTELSNRFQIQYSIEVKELSLSLAEYTFWSNIKLLNETGGDIFDKQPFSLAGNVKSIDGSEMALGYFQVSAVDKKQIYITEEDIYNMGLFKYVYDCEMIMVRPNESFMRSGYTFWSAVYDENGRIEGYIYVRTFCADCTLTGQISPPDFWVDL